VYWINLAQDNDMVDPGEHSNEFFGFPEIRETSWLDEEVLASEKGLYCVEWVSLDYLSTDYSLHFPGSEL
jgi:hypothetical protein